jgi:hypothetical protein
MLLGVRKKTAILILFLLISMIYTSLKIVMWKPYYLIAEITDYKSFIKLGLTTLITLPFKLPSGKIAIKKIGGDLLIVDSSNSKGILELYNKFPPPEPVLNKDSSWRVKVETLRKFVSDILPGSSPAPQDPEPKSALTLLGDNQYGKPYRKICSADAKIFVQYLSGLGIYSRMVQLNHHVSVEVWNKELNKWEYQDPHRDIAAKVNGNYLSASEIFDVVQEGLPVSIPKLDAKSIFKTVVYIPKANLADDELPQWHYFNYDNLSYWKVLRVSAESEGYWVKKIESAN